MAPHFLVNVVLKILILFFNTIFMRQTIRYDHENVNLRSNVSEEVFFFSK